MVSARVTIDGVHHTILICTWFVYTRVFGDTKKYVSQRTGPIVDSLIKNKL